MEKYKDFLDNSRYVTLVIGAFALYFGMTESNENYLILSAILLSYSVIIKFIIKK